MFIKKRATNLADRTSVQPPFFLIFNPKNRDSKEPMTVRCEIGGQEVDANSPIDLSLIWF